MNELETGKDRVKKICDILKKETIEPAKQEAREILENASIRARELIEKAKRESQAIAENAQKELEKKKFLVESSIRLASRQALDHLKEKIFHHLFNPALSSLIEQETKKEAVIAELIRVIIETIREKGIDVDLSVYIPKKIDAAKINGLVGKHILDILREKTILLDNFRGGARIKLHDQRITIDISDEAIRDLVSEYVREDFRHYLFEEK